MQTDQERLLDLLGRPNWTPEETQWVHRRMLEENDPFIREALSAYFSADLATSEKIDPAASERMRYWLREKISAEAGERRKPLYKRLLPAAAAAVLAIAALAAWWTLRQPAGEQPVQHAAVQITPGQNGAILTLADGQQLELDSTGNGRVATQGNMQIVQRNGGLAYEGRQPAPAKATEILYNELKTPRGRQFHITLPDGTGVWMNAASSLRFPATFPAGHRTVELQGEAYFEVARQAAKPFFVRVNGMEVAVLGTSFNINAYGDNGGVYTSLLSGSVRVNGGAETALLQPGQQAAYIGQSPIRINKKPDMQQVMAWKNGMFLYKAENIRVIMQQVSRWYDVEVEYAHPPDELFYVELPRTSKLEEVLKILTLTGKVKFKIEGRKIIVS